MNKRNKVSVDVLLKESLIVNPLLKTKNVERTFSDQKKSNSEECKSKIRTSQSAEKNGPSLVKCPLKSIPVGLEQTKPKPKPIIKPKKQSSTLDFLQSLRQIDVKTDSADFLEETNEELEIAFRQLQEIQKLIAEKIRKSEEVKEEKEMKERQKSIISRFSKQFERMHKKYLNKTRIKFRSLRDVENLTMTQSEVKDSNKVAEGEEVEVLYKNRNVGLVVASSVNLTQFEERQSRNESLWKKKGILRRDSKDMDKKKVGEEDQVKGTEKKFEFNVKPNERAFADKMTSLLNFEKFWFYDQETKSTSDMDEVDKIRYLLRPEHHLGIGKSEGMRNEATQSEDSKEKTVSEFTIEEFPFETVKNEKKSLSKNKKSTLRVRFSDAKTESVLKYNDQFTSFEEFMSFEEKGSKYDVKDSRMRADSEAVGDFWKDLQIENKSKQEDTKKVFKYDLCANVLQENEEIEKVLERESSCKSDVGVETKKIRKNEEPSKIDQSVSTSDEKKKKRSRCRTKLNLFLNFKDGPDSDSDGPDLVDSIMKSSYLSKEFMGVGFANKNKAAEKTSKELLESVIRKFQTQIGPSQLANLAEGRDQKLYTTLDTALKDTLYTEIQK